MRLRPWTGILVLILCLSLLLPAPSGRSLIGTPIADPERPMEVLRTIHSFDPCIACAVHLYDEKGQALHQVRGL